MRISRQISALADLSVSAAGSARLDQRDGLAVEENTGKLEAYRSERVDALHGEAPVRERLRCSDVKSSTGVALKAR